MKIFMRFLTSCREKTKIKTICAPFSFEYFYIRVCVFVCVCIIYHAAWWVLYSVYIYTHYTWFELRNDNVVDCAN